VTLENYLRDHFAQIEGWCWKYVWQPIAYIDGVQRSRGEDGPVCEIGVFKGKFFIGLASLKADQEKHLAIDVFGQQQFNMGGSGSPIIVPTSISQRQRPDFEKNLTTCGVGPQSVSILEADSLAIDASQIRPLLGEHSGFSMFSVDGCHEFTHAYQDTKLAMKLTATSGLIFIDDYYHQDWPGVHEAIAKIHYSEAPRFVPLFYIYNKLALCHVNYHSLYLSGLEQHFKENYPSVVVRPATRYGWKTLTIKPQVGSMVLPGLPASDVPD
jgi:hypothetical protein